ncbi:MAG: cytochrome c oxidase accessory protein CcoG [Bacteroidia bacterium]|nr:cytochrome c oxidase accessory protein CcoG [Bacteroidia bacterium]HQV00012.1 cytochrome c oxidase accessory protein CcoG [Bacteroidia bacterium]
MDAINNDESFRDSISTITAEGKRAWLYPKKPKGKLYNARTWVSYGFLIIFFALPWIQINGHPFMLFNVIERKFVLLGIAFFPQDFFLFVLAMLTFVVFIALFTALFGRLWCGWACPQTVFMEMVFRKIEYWIEGDMMQQKALDKRPWDTYKATRKISKHLIFFFISFVISNTFLQYIIGVDDWLKIVTDDLSQHKAGFISILVFTGIFYGVYARFREQVCIVVCPYGRLQGVLLDPNSVVVGYDYKRGEPRGKLTKSVENKLGDCIDCHQCVQVCPTGIDIRNGTQLECINCTACIDACDDIMDKIKKPHGLIRYTSENSIKQGIKFKITPRIIGYSAVLFVLLAALSVFLLIRTDIETTVLRTPGLLYQKTDSLHVSNLYNIEMVNKTFDDMPIELKVVEPKGEIKWVGNGITKLKQQSISQSVFFLIIPKSEIIKTKTKVKFEVYSNGKRIDKTETNFLGPNN